MPPQHKRQRLANGRFASASEVAKHKTRGILSKNKTAKPASLATRVVDLLRRAKGIPAAGRIVRMPHVNAFLERHSRELRSASSVLAFESPCAAMRIVYHGSAWPMARQRIIEENLRVPDGFTLRHKTDSGYFGKGIYTSPTFSLASSYAGGGPAFVCLSLPGWMCPLAEGVWTGMPRIPGFDSHRSVDDTEHVFFSSDQLLPCFLVQRQHLRAANNAVQRALDLITTATASYNTVDHPLDRRNGSYAH